MVLLGFWEHKRGQLAFPHYVALGIAFIIPAAYLSWLDEHQIRIKPKSRIETYGDANNRRRDVVRSTLLRFYNEAQSLLWEKISTNNFPDWAQREGTFGERAGQWITQNMGDAARAKFEDMSGSGSDLMGL